MEYKIRVAEIGDAKAIHDIYGTYVPLDTVTFTIENPSVEQYAEQIREVKKNYPYLVAESKDGEILGYVCGHPFRPHDAYKWNVESTICLSKDAPKRIGIATCLYNEFFKLLKQQGYKFVYGVLVDTNIESENLHKKLGFELVGELKNCGYKHGKWLGIKYYAKQIDSLEEVKEPENFTY